MDKELWTITSLDVVGTDTLDAKVVKHCASGMLETLLLLYGTGGSPPYTQAKDLHPGLKRIHLVSGLATSALTTSYQTLQRVVADFKNIEWIVLKSRDIPYYGGDITNIRAAFVSTRSLPN